MATQAVDAERVGPISTSALLLIWQDPQSRRFHKIGKLTRSEAGEYVFEYLPETRSLEGFEPLLQFPLVEEPNVFPALPPFIENRVLASERENYVEYLHWVGLEPDEENLPMEFLARTGGSRVTDTYHLVQEPPIEDGLYSRFFVSGVRHLDPEGQIVDRLQVSDELTLENDDKYDREPPAVFTVTVDGARIGYVPDWLADGVHELVGQDKRLTVIVEKVNPDAPHHLRLLCRIEAVSA